MIPIIAWRNVWRNKKRSVVIIASVTVGLWAGVFILALSFGMTDERKEMMINEHFSHIQIHDPVFKDKQEIGQYIRNGTKILTEVQHMPGVKKASGRILINGMLTAPHGSDGVLIKGIFPKEESELTGLNSKLSQGEYFPDKKNRIFLGEALADKLGLKLGSKIVLTFQDTSANMVAGAFRICGLYKTVNKKLDESLVYVKISDLTRILEMDTIIHEIAILANNDQMVDTLYNELNLKYPDTKVETWRQLSPELKYLDEMMGIYLYIFIGIILFALAFGLVNTMLMSVLERVRELGMLMSIGLNKTKLFLMILLETCFLAFTGAITGLILGFLSIYITGIIGIDLSIVQQGMEEFGMSTVLYPSLDWGYYPIIAGMVIVFAILSSIYPAIKALQLNPSQAIRKV